MKARMNKDGTYYGKVMIGRTPAGKPIYKRIIAETSVELWKLHYLLKNSLKKQADTGVAVEAAYE